MENEIFFLNSVCDSLDNDIELIKRLIDVGLYKGALNYLYELIKDTIKEDCVRKLKKKLKTIFNEHSYELFKTFPINERTKLKLINFGEYLQLIHIDEKKRKRELTIGIDDSMKQLFANVGLFNRYMYGFEYDIVELKHKYYEIIEKIKSRRSVTIRVQGDLMFGISNIEDYVKGVVEDIKTQLVRQYLRSMSLEIIDAIRNILIKNRIVCNVRFRNVSSRAFWDIEEMEFNVVCETIKLKRRIEYTDTLEKFLRKVIQELNQKYEWISHGDVMCTYRGIYGSEFGEIICQLKIECKKRLIEEIIDANKMVNDMFNMITDNVVIFGNHVVKYSGIPNRFRVRVGDNVFDVSLGNIIILSKPNTIIVEHNEHGRVELYFDIPVMIRLVSTGISAKERAMRNRIAIKKLKELIDN